MAAADRSTKDKEMASYMKRHSVVRTTMRCPMCPAVISITGQYGHLSNHAGNNGKDD